MAKKYNERFAILKGYVVRVRYNDGSTANHEFEYGEEATLETMISGYAVNMDSVDHFSVEKVWSQPGETVRLKVKNGWE